MGYVKYWLYKGLKNVSDYLLIHITRFEKKCNHTYPNGKSSLHGILFDTCKICGKIIMNDRFEKCYKDYYANVNEDNSTIHENLQSQS